VAWADGGAPEGSGAPPPAPRFVEQSSGFMDRPPDYVLQAPATLPIPGAGEPPYIKLWSKPPFRQDVYLEAVELRPGNRQVTHHSSAGMMRMPDGARLQSGAAWPGGPIVKDAVALLRNGEHAVTGVVTGNVMVFYVPGGGYQRFPPGYARRMRRDEYVLWSLHYMPTGTPQDDRHSLALWVAKTPPTHEVVTAAASEVYLVNGREVLSGDEQLLAPIPPRTSNYERTGIIAFREPVTLLALWPHMHEYGKDMTFVAVYPDGREETLLRVPAYDFNWQIQYELMTPLKLPAGSAIRATAHYDTTRRTRSGAAPDQPVAWGPQSWNEMFGPFLDVVYDNRRLVPEQRRDLFAPECGVFQDPFGRPCR
jgi:hypothetical protein